MPRLAKQLENEIRRIVREEIAQDLIDRNRKAFEREPYVAVNVPKGTDARAILDGEFDLESDDAWDFNFWFDRDSWGHRCHPSGRTVELKIDRSNCPQCAVERPDQAPERIPEWDDALPPKRRDESLYRSKYCRGESFYRAEFEEAVGYVDSRTWEQLVNYVRGGGMDWTRAPERTQPIGTIVDWHRAKHFVTRDGRQWAPEDVRVVVKEEPPERKCYLGGLNTPCATTDGCHNPRCRMERTRTSDEPIGQVIDRGEDEHGIWFTVKLDDDHWLHECLTFGRTTVVFGAYCHDCGMERSQARPDTAD